MGPLISATALGERVQSEPVAVLDARGGPDALQRYMTTAITNAIFVDLETELSQKSADAADGGRHPLPSAATFQSFLERQQIGPETPVVVYDDRAGANAAARCWWMLRAIGHQQVAVLDGGLEAAIQAGLTQVPRFAGNPNATPGYTSRDWQLPVSNIAEVAEAAGDPKRGVVDVREAYRYLGQSEPIDLVAGHIPGAINRPFVENLDTSGRFLDPAPLREKYSDLFANRQPDQVIVHCGSGVTACHTLLAWELAGFSGAKLYVGSWSEWSRNNRPIAPLSPSG